MKLSKIIEHLTALDEELGSTAIMEYSEGDTIVRKTEPEYIYDEHDEYVDNPAYKKANVIFEAEIVGGSMFEEHGDGMEIDIVIKVEDEYFKLDYYYSSWDSPDIDYDNFYKVEPVQVTYTEYRKPKRKKK